MKIAKALLISALSIFAALTVLSATGNSAAATSSTVKDITMQPGSNESMMNFSWYSSAGNSGCIVQVAKASEMMGTVFPNTADSFSGKVSAASKGYFSNKVTVTGLAPQTEYVYRVGNGTAYSEVYRFKTGDCSSYNAIFISDAQIGASGNISSDKAGWENTLSKALGKFSNAAFVLSAGDQVDYFLESEYDAFLASPLLRGIPIAPTVGNHENLSSSALNSYHYFEPNESSVYGVTPAGGDYWFRYGYTLYLILDTNNTNIKEHDAFIGQAVKANSDAVFTVLMFHQSIYSSAIYSTASSTIALRKGLYPVIDKYHIDLVLSGHDHCYTRTFPMYSGTVQKGQNYDSQGRMVNPTGTIYITAGSASGSKYYDMNKTPETYATIRLQLFTPTFSDIEVSGNSLTVTTYRADTTKAVDSFTIVKNTSSGFIDVPDNAWYTPAVEFIAGKNITAGTSNNTFSPDATLTRGQFVVMLMKAYCLAPDSDCDENFSDASNTYYTNYLSEAKSMGIVRGVGSNKFLPNGNISRQDMFTMLYNALIMLHQLPSGTSVTAPHSYSDSDQIAVYAREAIRTLTSDGILSGSGGKINPSGSSQRAQMAQVLYKLLSK